MTDYQEIVCERVAFFWVAEKGLTPNMFEECLDEIRKQIEKAAAYYGFEQED